MKVKLMEKDWDFCWGYIMQRRLVLGLLLGFGDRLQYSDKNEIVEVEGWSWEL